MKTFYLLITMLFVTITSASQELTSQELIFKAEKQIENSRETQALIFLNAASILEPNKQEIKYLQAITMYSQVFKRRDAKTYSDVTAILIILKDALKNEKINPFKLEFFISSMEYTLLRESTMRSQLKKEYIKDLQKKLIIRLPIIMQEVGEYQKKDVTKMMNDLNNTNYSEMW